jgi:NADH-quinone oxidoreductase subunit N
MFFITLINPIIYFLLPDFLFVISLLFLFCFYVFFFLTSQQQTTNLKFININISKFTKVHMSVAHTNLFLSFFLVLVFISFLISCFNFYVWTFSFQYDNSVNLFFLFDQLLINKHILFYKALLFFFLFFFLSISKVLIKKFNFFIIDYFFLILLSIFGALILLSSNNFLIFFLAIEIFSIPLYVLAAANKDSNYSTEAGLKYLIIGALSSAFILLGLSILYGITGVSSFSDLNLYCELNLFTIFNGDVIYTNVLAKQLDLVSTVSSLLLSYFHLLHLNSFLYLGVFFLLLGLLMKMGVAPFHFWMPDVYIGAPSNITFFFMTIQKYIMWVFLYELINSRFNELFNFQFFYIFSFLIVCNIFFGIFPALFQNKFKKLLIYSSIGVNSLLILPLLNNNWTAFILFLITYVVTNFGLFIFYFLLISAHSLKFYNKFYSLKSLAYQNPIITFCSSLLLISTAGLPPIFGFITKFNVFYTSFHLTPWLVTYLLIGSAFMSFYYFRIIRFMYILDNKKTTLLTSNLLFFKGLNNQILVYYLIYISLFLMFSFFYFSNIFISLNSL